MIKSGSEWLSNHGYNRVLRNSQRYSEISSGYPNLLYQEMLEEQWATEIAIRHLGLAIDDCHPEHIPGVNTIFNYQPFKKRGNYFVDLGGAIGSGKTTVMSRIEQLENPSIFCVPEPHEILKEMSPILELSSKTFLADKVSLAQQIEDLFVEKFNPSNLYRILFGERFYIDMLTSQRAQKLYGEWREYFPKDRKVSESSVNLRVPDAAIIIMTPPKVSFQHKTNDQKPGRFVNEEFIQVQYQQLLRSIYEMRQSHQPNLVVIDASVSLGELYLRVKESLELITQITL